MKWHNGDIYTGEWKNDKQNGKGKLIKHNQDIYEGAFSDGMLNGNVSVSYADGSVFRGIYKNNKRNGDFIEYDKNGQIKATGTYNNGVRHQNK